MHDKERKSPGAAGGARSIQRDKPGTQQRLLEAAWQVLGELGARAATTRAIAQRAGVNEVTVFRLFGTKDDLLTAALRERTAALATVTLPATDDLRADLLRLAAAYQDLARRHVGVLLTLLPDLRRDPALRIAVQPALHQLADAARSSFAHHQTRGALTTAQPVDHLVWAFLGPLFAAASLTAALGLDGDIDLAAHVEHYLTGHQHQ